MNLERDKFLTEQLGECWHKSELYIDEYHDQVDWRCAYCTGTNLNNKDFSTWEGFGKLWEWSQKQEWWGDFRPTEMLKLHLCKDFAWCNPDTFANAIYSYLKEKDK